MKFTWFIRMVYVHVERENSRPIISWHIILPSPQNTANYKVPRIAARFCYHYLETNRNYHYLETNRNLQKPNHTSARVSNDTNSPACVSNDICNPTRVSNDISGPIRLWHVPPIRLWHVSPIMLRHVSLTHPQTTINGSLPKAVKESWGEILKGPRSWEETKIEKSRSSVGTKLWILQELQLWIRRAFEEKSSKSSS